MERFACLACRPVRPAPARCSALAEAAGAGGCRAGPVGSQPLSHRARRQINVPWRSAANWPRPAIRGSVAAAPSCPNAVRASCCWISAALGRGVRSFADQRGDPALGQGRNAGHPSWSTLRSDAFRPQNRLLPQIGWALRPRLTIIVAKQGLCPLRWARFPPYGPCARTWAAFGRPFFFARRFRAALLFAFRPKCPPP
jgi:hypothetical protein